MTVDTTSAPAWRKLSLGGLRRSGRDWLDRPMTSLHLVLAIFALMLGFGLLMVLSSSGATAYQSGVAGSSFAVFSKQATFAGIGLVGFFLTSRMPVRLIRNLSTTAVLLSLVLLVAVLVPGIGKLKYGARSWINLGPFQFQPSEIAKLTLLLWAANVLASRRSTLRSLPALLIPVLPVFVLMVGLIMLEPDLGTTVTLTIAFLAVLYFAGAPIWIFAVIGTAGVAGLGGLIFTATYRLDRLKALLNPEAYPKSSYQLLQGLYGMGSGGVFGVGVGQSKIKWSWLPNADSDFIFAVIGEELGLIGTGIIVLLFGLLAYTGLRIARRNVDPFIKIVAAAGTVWLVGQAVINIGYVVGLLPVTGIPLPMISTGGTSLIITMVVFGLLANFARREPQAATALHRLGPGRVAAFLGIGSRSGSRAPRRRAAERHPRRAAEQHPRRAAEQHSRRAAEHHSRRAAEQRSRPTEQRRPARPAPALPAGRPAKRYRIRRALGFPLPAAPHPDATHLPGGSRGAPARRRPADGRSHGRTVRR